MLRDVLIRQIPTVLQHDLYAVPALAGAAVVVGAHGAGTTSEAFPLIGFAVCFAIRIVGLRYNIQLPGHSAGATPGARTARRRATPMTRATTANPTKRRYIICHYRLRANRDNSPVSFHGPRGSIGLDLPHDVASGGDQYAGSKVNTMTSNAAEPLHANRRWALACPL